METQNDLFSRAVAELAGVEAELRKLDAQRATLLKRRDELSGFVAQGRRLFGQETQQPAKDSLTTIVGALSVAFAAEATRQANFKDQVIKIAKRLIQDRAGGRVRTAEVVQMLEHHYGIQINAKDKSAAVSVILSRSPEFTNDRALGWGLAEKENPQNVAASAGRLPGESQD